jgi:sec-independent protein translocase protein TatA
MDVGPAELLIVLVIALVLFGGKKLPELARSLGQARNEFEKGAKGDTSETGGDQASRDAAPSAESTKVS